MHYSYDTAFATTSYPLSVLFISYQKTCFLIIMIINRRTKVHTAQALQPTTLIFFILQEYHKKKLDITPNSWNCKQANRCFSKRTVVDYWIQQKFCSFSRRVFFLKHTYGHRYACLQKAWKVSETMICFKVTLNDN